MLCWCYYNYRKALDYSRMLQHFFFFSEIRNTLSLILLVMAAILTHRLVTYERITCFSGLMRRKETSIYNLHNALWRHFYPSFLPLYLSPAQRVTFWIERKKKLRRYVCRRKLITVIAIPVLINRNYWT